MQNKILLVSACGFILAIGPFLFVKAQNRTDEDQKAVREKAERKKARREIRERKEKQQARTEISESLVGRLLLDAVTVNAPDWELTRGAFSKRREDDDSAGTNLDFGLADEKVAISISEYPSVQEANRNDSPLRSGGYSQKDERFGENGERITGDKGVFWMLTFRKGNYRVMIASRNEKNAEQFAAYVSLTLANLIEPKQK